MFGPAPLRATLDGQPVELASHGDRIEFTLPTGETIEPAAEGGQLTVQPSGNGFKLVGRCSVRVPPKATASVRLLCDFHGKEQQPLACQATVNGRPAKVEIVRKKLENDGEDSEPDRFWAWFKFDVPAGQSQIELTIDNYQADGKPLAGQVGWWLWTERPAKPHKLVLEFDRAVVTPTDGPLPLPLEMEHFRQVAPIRRLAPLQIENAVGTHYKEDVLMRTIVLLAVSISMAGADDPPSGGTDSQPGVESRGLRIELRRVLQVQYGGFHRHRAHGHRRPLGDDVAEQGRRAAMDLRRPRRRVHGPAGHAALGPISCQGIQAPSFDRRRPLGADGFRRALDRRV